MARLKSNGSSSMSILAIALVLMALVGQSYGQYLSVRYYEGKCSTFDVENEIFGVVKGMYNADNSIAAALLRLLFHDGYSGMDGSLLLNGLEKTAPPNLSVRGYNVIDACKTHLEIKCPGVVSCTDILVIATRVTVALAGGPWYNVETGRRDGLTSNPQDAANLPGATITVKDAVSKFALRGLSPKEFVLLMGAHTVGKIGCKFIIPRLYNFLSTGLPDPTMNKTLVASLRKTCPSGGSSNFAYADQTVGSSSRFDNGYYLAIKQGKGLLQIDQNIALDPITKGIVDNFAKTDEFVKSFAGAINKLARFGALTGAKGQIRKICSRIN